jgi:hypothetical protein
MRHLSSHNKAQHETNSSPHLISKSCSLQIDNAAFSAPSQVERASTKEKEGKHGKVEEKLYYNRLRLGINAREQSFGLSHVMTLD